MSGNLNAAILFLVNTLLSLYGMVVLLRFLLQLVRADFYNPLSQFVVKATNPLLRPLRRIVPGAFGIDFAALLLTWLVALLTVAALVAIAGASLPPLLLLFWYALLKCVVLLIHLYFFTLIVQVILSWVSPGWSPVSALLHTLNAPLLRPFRKFIPPLGGIDLSPLFALILLQFVSFLVPLPPLLR